MQTSLSGRSILLVEDEPLIALDIAQAFKRVGATVVPARSLADAKRLVEQDDLSAAVVDFGLGDGDADALCARLNERAVPFVLHSGYSHVDNAYSSHVVVPKPAKPATLIDAVSRLLSDAIEQRG
jgi:DNA-binding NtrC family response regulator